MKREWLDGCSRPKEPNSIYVFRLVKVAHEFGIIKPENVENILQKRTDMGKKKKKNTQHLLRRARPNVFLSIIPKRD